MKIGIIGLGYVGLVTATCLAQLGFKVFSIDSDPEKIKKLQSGILPIYEPGLQELFSTCITQKKLQFFDYYQSLANLDAYIITVGTPSNDADGSVNLTYIKNAMQQLCPYLPSDALIIVKSTVPPGTCKMLTNLIRSEKPDLN